MAQRPKTAIVALKLRLRESLRRPLAAEAKKAGRSLNSEMVRRLERSFRLECDLEEARLKLAEQELAVVILAQAKQVLSSAAELYGQAVPPERRPQRSLLADRVAEIEKNEKKRSK